jgi:hypothetical protein
LFHSPQRRLIPMISITVAAATKNGYVLFDPALKSRARLKCRSAAGEFRPSFHEFGK